MTPDDARDRIAAALDDLLDRTPDEPTADGCADAVLIEVRRIVADELDAAEDLLQHHTDSYFAAAARQRAQALALLTQRPADFSGAATACHRALQFERQGEALQQALRELRADRWRAER